MYNILIQVTIQRAYMKNIKPEIKTIKLKNYKQFTDTVSNAHEQELEIKKKASSDYIEYIKKHDKEAYENYLSYSTYLKT